MQLSDVALLTSEAGRRLLDELPPYDQREALSIGARLRRVGHSPDLVAAVLTQARLRADVGRRWGTHGAAIVPHLLLTPDGAEQATRPSVAALRADRYRRSGEASSTADLGCGIGLDALALAGAGLQVAAYDSDPLTAAVAEANAASMGVKDQVAVAVGDVTDISVADLSRHQAVFADPARRRNGRRLLRPETWSPPLAWVLDLPAINLGVKVAPGLDRDGVRADTEFAVVSDGGDVLEAALYRGALRTQGISRSAILLPSGARVTDAELPRGVPRVEDVGKYLHEPDGAVIRAGLVAAVAHQLDGWLIDPQIAYVSNDTLAASPFVASYEVLDVMPFSLKRLRAHLREQGVGQVVVKKRGSAIDVDELRKSLRLDRSKPGRRTILLTRLGSDPVAIVARPVST